MAAAHVAGFVALQGFGHRVRCASVAWLVAKNPQPRKTSTCESDWQLFNGDTNKVDSWPVTAIRIAYQCVLEACLLERAKGARPTVRENNDPPTILVSFRPVILLIGEGWLVMNALGRASVSAKKDSGHEL